MNGKAMMAGTTTPLIPSGAELVSAHKSKSDATKSYRYGSFFLFPALSALCMNLFVSRCRHAYGEEDASSLPGWSVRDRWR